LRSFRLLHRRGTAPQLFADQSDFAGVPTIVDVRVTEPALVLGSTQPAALVPDPPIDVVRRRSGGGAVLVEPGDVAWVDVFLPAGDPLWQDDVGRSFWWLGDAWAAALEALGLAGRVEVHKGPLVAGPWSPLVCFAGLGPGEVTVDGRKAVGMAQRRTRAGALFQCAVPIAWRPERLLALFDPMLPAWEQPLQSSEQPLAQSEQQLESWEQALSLSEQPLAQSERPLKQWEQSLQSLEQPLAQSEQPLAQSERSLEQSERPLARSERPLAQSERPLAQSERPITRSGVPSGWEAERWERVRAGLADEVFAVGPLSADDCIAALLEALAVTG
jgi:lipoate-protein ligase A